MDDNLTIDYGTSTSTQAFADDSQLCIISDNLSELESSANVCLNQLETHASLKKMKFSPDKSKAVIYTRKRGSLADINLIFKNESIAVTKCEPLLGLHLDSKLNWKTHISKQSAKCKSLIFKLNACCKLTWGVNKDILRRIWYGIIEPILLYACPCWISSVDKIWIKKELQSVQRLMAIRMIKGFKTISFEAAVLLSGLTPITLKAKERALTYAVKHPEHYLNYTPINDKHTSHIEATLSLAFEYGISLNDYELPVKNLIAHPTDRIPIKNIDLEMSDSYPLFSEHEFIFYTDGSKSDYGTGCSVEPMSHNVKANKFKLRKDNSIFQAEAFAILQVLVYLLTIPIMKLSTKNVLIFTDSKSVLKSLQDCYHESSMIQNILLLHRLIYKITNTSISLKWCPGHKDILGNELADFFAMKSYANFNCSTYFLPFPVSSMKQNVRKINRKKWQLIWDQSTKGRTTYEFLQSVELPASYLRSTVSHKLTQILTGHCCLNFYLSTIGRASTPVCKCKQGIETIDHYLFKCTLHKEIREQSLIPACNTLLIPFPPTKSDIMKNELLLHALKSFLNKSKRLDFQSS